MKKYVIANWKSNKEESAVKPWFTEFKRSLGNQNLGQTEVIIAPPFPLLATTYNNQADCQVAVQDISPFPAGSYTGGVSTTNLAGLNVTYAIVGHSERRRHFHESHQDVANKVAQCLEAGITPIVCVDDEYIAEQAAAIAAEHLDKCIVAYEELGAIGTGNNESSTKVSEVVQRIKVVFNGVPVLYGGSVKPENVTEYIQICDGVLVGGASLDPAAFAKIARAFAAAS